ncbi:hypothetical protein BASA50_000190 [Batrachochytrium salamandrivorans]|uniref:Oxidoreductase-like domain-containing protein n=1 Tax=Batrachochytrium salamandrivorans TaxID=1357716 RepID=A0ABQ8EUJ2_9FUNG|nr:hypothetical protein BASA60_002901 [Batrachochytrium salamandrivorans]KAH6586826.1 hypothetical protein BASA50_000190 [Batrachochytrium salamandrivorans]KAH9251685.1 hypothetical protein BASA81_010453 [Batrachochytrium salamandrivorans]
MLFRKVLRTLERRQVPDSQKALSRSTSQSAVKAHYATIQPDSSTVKDRRYAGFWSLILETPLDIAARKTMVQADTELLVAANEAISPVHSTSSTVEDYPLRSPTHLSTPSSSNYADISSIASISLKLQVLKSPEPPSSTDCCMGGCRVCVWDVYAADMDTYTTTYKMLVDRWTQLGGASDNNAVLKARIDPVEMDPSIKAFRDFERTSKAARRLEAKEEEMRSQAIKP